MVADVDWEYAELWEEVSKWLNAKTILRIALANHWFKKVLTDDIIWKQTLLRDLKVEDGNDLELPEKFDSWLDLYKTVVEGTFDRVLGGGLASRTRSVDPIVRTSMVFESKDALLTELNHGDAFFKLEKVKNVKTGLWIFESIYVRCLFNHECDRDCSLMYCIDGRHAELFVMDGFESWQYERVEQNVVHFTADCLNYADWGVAIFDSKHASPSAEDIFHPGEEYRTVLHRFPHGIAFRHRINVEYESTRTDYHIMRAALKGKSSGTTRAALKGKGSGTTGAALKGKSSGEVVAIRICFTTSVRHDDGFARVPLKY
ncbi:hypothetical protein OROMI_010164 [Orobanche minor]